MKKLNILFAATSLLIMTGCSNAGKTEEHATHTKDSVSPAPQEAQISETPVDTADMQKAWEAYMTPGDMHKLLAGADGKWNAEMTFWMGPDAQASPPSNASVESKMVLGGRYQVSEYKGTMMGMPFEGKQTTAYDNAKKKFITTWIDNTGTGMMYMEGSYDAGTKTMTYSGKMTDPSSGKETEMRQVVSMPDDKTQIMEMYDKKGGKEYKSMEIKLTKK